jgi:hypothetical protein
MGVLRCAVEIADVTKTRDDCLVLTALACDDAKPRGALVGQASGVSLTFCLCELLAATAFIHQVFRFTLNADSVSINSSREDTHAHDLSFALALDEVLALDF